MLCKISCHQTLGVVAASVVAASVGAFATEPAAAFFKKKSTPELTGNFVRQVLC